ncbi:hypothetical protein GCM10009030_16560 [Haloarcula pellucida]|uniref:Uncharacterized protein n=1 Tax=Haloarcula pellucida TaxID=1427151 RepID=A0A830GJU0_9EURY|nr:hypothetical protein GCM10009030_16560 [Halomicroarcula pellucida]
MLTVLSNRVVDSGVTHRRIRNRGRSQVRVGGVGGAHDWDSYEQAIVVVEGDDAERAELAATPVRMLGMV